MLPFEPFLNSENSYITDYHLGTLTQTLIYVLLAMGLNIVVGLAGLLDLGFVAFYAVGAYGYALITLHLGEFGIGFWWAIPITASLAAFAGCMLGFPVLRMHGDYLAIVTLGFGEIIRILLVNMIDITGGPNGISVPRPTLFGLGFTRKLEEGQMGFHEFFGLSYSASYRYIFIYLLILAFTVVAIWIFKRLREMPIGRAWEALREDEIACKALGINHTTTKLSAFTLGATFGGVGGVFFAAMEGFINPSSFTFVESAIILSIVVLGGMGSIVGVIIAAVGITLLPELFREFESYRMLVFGLAMVFIMIWRPGGLLKVRRKSFARGGDGS
jgi:branched-chain amino acid transport system permease protein